MIWWFEKNRGVSIFITLVEAGLIFWISTLNFGAGVGDGFSLIPTIYHILAFFFFGFFVSVSITGGKKGFSFFLIAFLIAIAYALTDEIHQYFVPWKFTSIGDVFLDLVGIILALMTYLVILFKR